MFFWQMYSCTESLINLFQVPKVLSGDVRNLLLPSLFEYCVLNMTNKNYAILQHFALFRWLSNMVSMWSFYSWLSDKLSVYRVAVLGFKHFPVITLIRIIYKADGGCSFLECFNCFQKCNSEAQPPPTLQKQKSQGK